MRTSMNRTLWAAVALALLATPPPARADKCAAAKLKAIGKKEARLLGCQSKVAAKNDTSGLAACESKVKGKFSNAFGKSGTCGGDQTQCENIADSCESSVAGAFIDTWPSKCEAAKRKAAGKLASSELGCYAKAAAKSAALDGGCISKATGKFSTALTKAGACPDGGSPQMLVEGSCVQPAVPTNVGGIVTDVCPTLGVCTCGFVAVTPGANCPPACRGSCATSDVCAFLFCATATRDCLPSYAFCGETCS